MNLSDDYEICGKCDGLGKVKNEEGEKETCDQCNGNGIATRDRVEIDTGSSSHADT